MKNIKINKLKKTQIILLVILLICSFSLILIFARFVTDEVNDFFVRSKEFYFNSDKLSEDTAVYQINNWSGVDKYEIIVDMNSVENGLLSASYDIGYEVSFTCSSNAIGSLDKTSGIIYSSTNHDTFVLTLTPNAQLSTGDSIWAEITATSTSQYKKTLKGKFTLVVGKEDLTYQITDSVNSPYLNLRITNTSSYYQVNESFDSYAVGDKIDSDTYMDLDTDKKKKCGSAIVSIGFDPKNVLLDMTDENYEAATNVQTTVVNGNTYISGFTISMKAISSVDIRFYKSDITQNYTYPVTNSTSIIDVNSIN